MNLQYKKSAVVNKISKIFLGLVFLGTLSLQAQKPALMRDFTPVSPSIDAPALYLENTDEEMVDIKKFRGQVVIVNFWATWCPPCTREMVSLDNLYKKFKDEGLVVLAVNVGEDEDAVFDFSSMMDPELTATVLYDSDSKTMQKWNAIGLPSTFVINKKGKIVYQAVGGRDFNDKKIVNKIHSLLKE